MVQQADEGLVHLESYHQSTELTLFLNPYSGFVTTILQIAMMMGNVLLVQQAKVKTKNSVWHLPEISPQNYCMG